MLQQIVYISTGCDVGEADLADVLHVSREKNAKADVTGFLFFDGKRFLQALEGREADIDRTLRRIRADGRHRSIVILSDRRVADREFGTWSMACRAEPDLEDEVMDQIQTLVAGASPSVRATFTSFSRIRTAR